jgi:hypothetical protein
MYKVLHIEDRQGLVGQAYATPLRRAIIRRGVYLSTKSISIQAQCNDCLRQRTTLDVVAAAGPVQLS